MNGGSIVVRGSVGDTAGYAMRGGEIYVQGNAGYRAGIHMKAYQDQQPVIVIGGRAGSFLGNIRQAARSWCWDCIRTESPPPVISPARDSTAGA